MDKVQSIPNQSQIPKNGQALGKFSDSGPSNPQNSDRLWADFGPSNPQNCGQPYIGASRGLERDLPDSGPLPREPRHVARPPLFPLVGIWHRVNIPLINTSVPSGLSRPTRPVPLSVRDSRSIPDKVY